MRALLGLVIVAFLGWSGWWWFASGAARTGAETVVANLQAQGWQASHGGIAVAGYPNRIDLTLTEPRLATPDRAWGWQAPFAQVFALSYRPWHLIAAFATEQRLQTPAGDWRLQAGKLQSSLVLVPGADLQLDRMQMAGEALVLKGPVQVGLDRLALATRPAVGKALAQDIGLEVTGITPDPRLVAALPAGLFPGQAEILRLDAEVTLTAALDRHAMNAPPQIDAIMLREARLSWGPVKLHLSGRLAPDAAGRAEGDLALRLEGAQAALQLAVAAGLLDPATRGTWAGVIDSLAPGGAALDLPLRLSRGMITLGPLPIGPAPLLR